jgi:hypothetical protein
MRPRRPDVSLDGLHMIALPRGRNEVQVVAAVVAVHSDPQASAEVQHSEQEPQVNHHERRRMGDGRTQTSRPRGIQVRIPSRAPRSAHAVRTLAG